MGMTPLALPPLGLCLLAGGSGALAEPVLGGLVTPSAGPSAQQMVPVTRFLLR